METLAFHPGFNFFLMADRLFKGKWNAALFDHQSGSKLHDQNVGFRISASTFTPDGKTLYTAGNEVRSYNLETGEFKTLVKKAFNQRRKTLKNATNDCWSSEQN